jgi:hypothetical protein
MARAGDDLARLNEVLRMKLLSVEGEDILKKSLETREMENTIEAIAMIVRRDPQIARHQGRVSRLACL